MNAHPQQYMDAQSRLTNLATISGVARFAPLAKLFQRGGGHVQVGAIRYPRAPPTSPSTLDANVSLQLDPEEYQHAKKKLKKAVLELYR